MISIQLASKKDVLKFKAKFREACEKHGLRLGKSNQKAEAIITELFNATNFNTLVAKASEGGWDTSSEITNSVGESQYETSASPLAKLLNMSDDELEEMAPDIYENNGNSGDGLYNYFFYVPESTPREVLERNGWKVGDLIDDIPLNIHSEPDDF